MFLAGAVLGLGVVVSEDAFDVAGYVAAAAAEEFERAGRRLAVGGWELTHTSEQHFRAWKRFRNGIHEVQAVSLDLLEEAARGYDALQDALGERERAAAREVERAEAAARDAADVDAAFRQAELRLAEERARREVI
jgi:hypothetical protein